MFDIYASDDMIDVRNIIERVEELRNERDTMNDDDGELPAVVWADHCPVNAEELATLELVLDDLRGNGGDEQWEGDWYPVTLIRDSYFETAMDDLLEDIGDLPRDLPSYLKVTIDYRALQMDYTSTEIDGTTYWYR